MTCTDEVRTLRSRAEGAEAWRDAQAVCCAEALVRGDLESARWHAERAVAVAAWAVELRQQARDVSRLAQGVAA